MKFTIISDHKPLESIVKKLVSKAPARLQRMLLRLQRYNINLLGKPGRDMIFADTLSRAHLKEDGEEINEEEINAQIHMICSNTASDEKTRKIQEMTQKDDVLQQLKIFITNGWPKQKSDLTGEILSYWSFQEKLSVINGTIYKGHRIVIPKLMRQEILENLHQSHMGISKTKARARETVYWPNINQHIEMLIKKCEVCQTYQKQQQKEPMIPSDIPIYPFQIVASDLFNWNNQDFAIVVDYYSKYWEIERLYDTKSITIVKKMKKMFSRLGIPETLRSDNGPQYTAQVFKEFSKEWNFKNVTSSQEYPKSNGFVERHIQIVKKILTKAKQS